MEQIRPLIERQLNWQSFVNCVSKILNHGDGDVFWRLGTSCGESVTPGHALWRRRRVFQCPGSKWNFSILFYGIICKLFNLPLHSKKNFAVHFQFPYCVWLTTCYLSIFRYCNAQHFFEVFVSTHLIQCFSRVTRKFQIQHRIIKWEQKSFVF